MEKKELAGSTVITEMQGKAGETVVPVSLKEESAVAQPVSDKKNDDGKQGKQTALKHETTPEVFLQYREYEVTMEAVTERVKAHYYAKGYKEGSIEDIQIYVKPEDFTAYYVINDGIVGKVNLF